MDMQYKVFRGQELIFQDIYALPEVAAGKAVNVFAETARAEFRAAFPEVSLSDQGIREEWVNLGPPDSGDNGSAGAA